jgi:hypothetical protein
LVSIRLGAIVKEREKKKSYPGHGCLSSFCTVQFCFPGVIFIISLFVLLLLIQLFSPKGSPRVFIIHKIRSLPFEITTRLLIVIFVAVLINSERIFLNPLTIIMNIVHRDLVRISQETCCISVRENKLVKAVLLTVQTRKGFLPLAVATQTVLRYIQERRVCLTDTTSMLFQPLTLPTPVRSSRSLWPRQYGPATHYGHASTVHHSQCTCQYGPATHYGHTSSVQPIIMATPAPSSHLQCPRQYGPATHSAHFVQLQSFSSRTSPEARFSQFQPSHCSRHEQEAFSHMVLNCLYIQSYS